MAAVTSLADQAIRETIERALARYPQHEARIRRAAELLAIDAVRHLGGDRYSVRSQANATREYLVTLPEDGPVTCQCPDFEKRGRGCKHAFAVWLHYVAAIRYAVLVERQAVAPDPHQWAPEEAKRLQFARWMAARGIIQEGE